MGRSQTGGAAIESSPQDSATSPGPFPENENDAIVMEEFAIAINLNITDCWLKLKEFELAKHQCDVV